MKILRMLSEGRIAALGMVVSTSALLSATACCVLPLAFASLGIGAGSLALIVPWHWPLTIAAVAAVALGWYFYIRKRRVAGAMAVPAKAPLVMLCVATVIAAISALWKYIEAPLMTVLEG
jgi:mercuric ion transport protein